MEDLKYHLEEQDHIRALWHTIVATDRELVRARKEIAMLRDQNIAKDINLDSNVVDLTKGKLLKLASDNTITDENWLWKLSKGTLFLTKPRNTDPRVGPNPILQPYLIEDKHEEFGFKAVKVLSDLNEPSVEAWLDSAEYCKGYMLAGVLYDGTETPLTE